MSKVADRQAAALRELHKAIGALWAAHAFLPPTHPHVERLRRMQRDAEDMLAESERPVIGVALHPGDQAAL